MELGLITSLGDGVDEITESRYQGNCQQNLGVCEERGGGKCGNRGHSTLLLSVSFISQLQVSVPRAQCVGVWTAWSRTLNFGGTNRLCFLNISLSKVISQLVLV